MSARSKAALSALARLGGLVTVSITFARGASLALEGTGCYSLWAQVAAVVALLTLASGSGLLVAASQFGRNRLLHLTSLFIYDNILILKYLTSKHIFMDQTTDAARQRALSTYVKLSRAADAVHNRVNAHLQAYDLTTSQFGVLEVIYHRGPLQIGEIGAKILKSSGNMTLVVDNLIKRSLVYRQRLTDDRRCIQIHLTDAGRVLLERIWDKHAQGVVEVFAVLSAEEQDQLAALCRKLGLAQSTPP